MKQSKRSIFRESAVRQYIQRREKDILPHLVSPSVLLFFWILLGLLICAGLLAWSGQVPTYVVGSGIMLMKNPHSTDHEAVALVFLPSTHSLPLRVGLPIELQIGATGPYIISTIMSVEAGIINPHEARQRYALDGAESQVITQPSLVVIVGLGSIISAQMYAGSIVSAQVQVGSRRILSLLPGLEGVIN